MIKVLITGAGGSIASEIARQIQADLILLNHSELPLVTLQREIKGIPVVGDIRDGSRMMEVFKRYRPDVVIHTAALKHVPVCEVHPREAALTNVIGTVNIHKACQSVNAKLIHISTDKAVNPNSVYGATKRMAELYLSQFDVKIVRLGNVLGSSGSVVPLFRKLIAEGKNLTVTHPEVERYFLPVEEAAKFIIETIDKEGSLFIPNMGTPIRIRDLAERMIKESGKDLRIDYIGLRPGEKLKEVLEYKSETKKDVSQAVIDLRTADDYQVLTILKRTLPEYTRD